MITHSVASKQRLAHQDLGGGGRDSIVCIKLSSSSVLSGTALKSLMRDEIIKIEYLSGRPHRYKILHKSINKYARETITQISINNFNIGATCKEKKHKEISNLLLICNSTLIYKLKILVLFDSMNRKLISSLQIFFILDLKKFLISWCFTVFILLSIKT